MTLQTFVKKRPYLFWSSGPQAQLSESAVVEGVLNYGDLPDVRKLVTILGKDKVTQIFYKSAGKKRSNYDPRIKHFFRHYFKTNA
ncbi:MAG: hypothetical protein A3A73_02980 [Omnitrophica bacterium RIFCSPLOWO2_01_FULL_50_24]|nr:MAG: hypothetical protein A3A73_02980 [Omnitrophica bacterium RIFCSPLOWO2_01_FULL_50_24]